MEDIDNTDELSKEYRQNQRKRLLDEYKLERRQQSNDTSQPATSKIFPFAPIDSPTSSTQSGQTSSATTSQTPKPLVIPFPIPSRILPSQRKLMEQTTLPAATSPSSTSSSTPSSTSSSTPSTSLKTYWDPFTKTYKTYDPATVGTTSTDQLSAFYNSDTFTKTSSAPVSSSTSSSKSTSKIVIPKKGGKKAKVKGQNEDFVNVLSSLMSKK
jgi:hypothetical protein